MPAIRRLLRTFALFPWLLTFALIQPSPVLADEVSPNAIEIPNWFKESFLDIRADIAEAAAQKKRVMLYFGQDGCPYCKALMQVNFSQKDIVDRMHTSFDAIALNMWGDREVTWLDGKTRTEKEFAAFMKVQFTPTLLFFDEKGNVVLRLNGYYPPHKFRVALDYVSKHLEGSVPYSEYLQTASPVPDTGLFHDEKFFQKPPYNFQRTGKPAKKPLAVFFEQQHCSGCDEMHSIALQDKEIQELISKFQVARLNLHGQTPVVTTDGKKMTESEWARNLKVAFTPSIVFFDQHGKEVFRVEAYLKTFHLASSFDYVASGAYKTQPSFQRYVELRADELRNNGITVDLWK